MRATLNIPDDLIEETQRLTGEKSKTKAIVTAMKEYIKDKKVKMLLELRGKISIDYNWQKEEELELQAQIKRDELYER